MNSKLYDLILDIDIDSKTISEIFGTEDEEIVRQHLDRIVDMARAMHDEFHSKEKCDRKCKGIAYYLIKAIKIYLTSHKDMEDNLAIRVLCASFFNLGGNASEKVPDVRSLGDLMNAIKVGMFKMKMDE